MQIQLTHAYPVKPVGPAPVDPVEVQLGHLGQLSQRGQLGQLFNWFNWAKTLAILGNDAFWSLLAPCIVGFELRRWVTRCSTVCRVRPISRKKTHREAVMKLNCSCSKHMAQGIALLTPYWLHLDSAVVYLFCIDILFALFIFVISLQRCLPFFRLAPFQRWKGWQRAALDLDGKHQWPCKTILKRNAHLQKAE